MFKVCNLNWTTYTRIHLSETQTHFLLVVDERWFEIVVLGWMNTDL